MKFSSGSRFNTTFLSKFFTSSLDTRRTDKGNFKHSFHDILLVVLVGVLCGIKEYGLIVRFAKSELSWLKKYGDFSNGIPSDETIRRFMIALDPIAFQDCYRNWMTSLCNFDGIDTIAIDGKTIRGASTKSNPTSLNPHILTAWASEQGLALGQFRVHDKSNEITAIPELLKLVFIKGSIITIDAMGCQKDIVSTIMDRGGDYIIAVKGNQKSLYQAVKDTALLETPDDIEVDQCLGNGRVTTRTCKVYHNLTHLGHPSDWVGLQSFITVESEVFCKTTQRTTTEKRCYISSVKQNAKKCNTVIRKHWSIENQLHWHLDVNFQEDASRKRTGHAAENFNIIFKSALTLLKKDNSKRKSIKQKCFEALINKKYREKILNL